jgi:hypothetical protein
MLIIDCDCYEMECASDIAADVTGELASDRHYVTLLISDEINKLLCQSVKMRIDPQ